MSKRSKGTSRPVQGEADAKKNVKGEPRPSGHGSERLDHGGLPDRDLKKNLGCG